MASDAGRVIPLPKGAWNSATSYETLDIVSHNNSSWMAKRNNIGIEPAEGEIWTMYGSSVGKATTTAMGIVKIPEDGSITIDQDGTIHAAGGTADKIDYDGTGSGLTADNVQDAVDELAAVVDQQGSDISSHGDSIEALERTNEIERKTLYSGNTSISFTDERINENSIFSFYTSVYGVNPTDISVSGNTVTLAFKAQGSNIEVGVRIDG